MYDITAEAKTHRAELAPALLVVFNKLGGGEFGTFCFDARFVKTRPATPRHYGA